MNEPDDISLLRQFAAAESEIAFAALVSRHLNLVYSVAVRSVGNAHAAQEISQAVFIILARKAKSLGPKTILSAWLYQTTRLTAANFLRGEIRRQQREQEAYMQSTLNEPEPEAWRQIAPLLDDALDKLGERDRNAIVLRFFENKSLHEIGATLGASEEAAKMRVNRALDKLRKIFGKRGVTLSTTLIAGAVSAGSVQAAPASLAVIITAVAAKGTVVSGSTLTLVKGALKVMAWTKVQTAMVVSVVILLAGGTTTVIVGKIHERQNEAWQLGNINSDFLLKPPYRTVILPTRSAERNPKDGSGGTSWFEDGRIYGVNIRVEEMVRLAYTKQYGAVSPCRTMFYPEVTTNKFDFFSNLPIGSKEALKHEIKGKFKIVGRFETIETNVLILKVKYPNSFRLKASRSKTSSFNVGNGKMSLLNESIDDLANQLENCCKIPIINQTGLTNNFDFEIKWNNDGKLVGAADYPDLDALKKALAGQLGLELVSSREPIEALIVEKAN
jgi:uncharacterized protein (TIGR03435 family)